MVQSEKGQGSANKVRTTLVCTLRGTLKGRAELILPTWRAWGDLWGWTRFDRNRIMSLSACGAQCTRTKFVICRAKRVTLGPHWSAPNPSCPGGVQ